MNRNVMSSVAIFSTPASIVLNVDAWLGQIQIINLILALVVSAVSLISLFFVIRKNYYAMKLNRLNYRKRERNIEN